MKIICLSDTHGYHRKIEIPADADMVIHAGDLTMSGEASQVEDFLDWFQNLPNRFKVFTAGNHDWFFEMPENAVQTMLSRFPGVTYLNDSGITIEGLHIWGSPISPFFLDWAFNRRRGSDIKKHWDLIPENTDILITHGPVYEMHDLTDEGTHVGCRDLQDRIKQLPQLKLFCCGHIHECGGQMNTLDGVTYINASSLTERYKIRLKKPFVEFIL